ncbi:unnamed protein product [Lactuca virosa]|uniref:Uncharacterized protein n=1 Tax=Lactuca virosa TaxID=75947 RepID=A0AAU9M3Y7_9ASTR|nr:unnamed protein product [Lactuca virosa]
MYVCVVLRSYSATIDEVEASDYEWWRLRMVEQRRRAQIVHRQAATGMWSSEGDAELFLRFLFHFSVVVVVAGAVYSCCLCRFSLKKWNKPCILKIH